MALDVVSYVLSMGYTSSSLTGAGALKGEQGEAGKSAYEIACDNGFQGTEQEWIDSLIGEDGKSPTITTERTTDDDGAIITVTNPDGTTSTTTVYDGKGVEMECEVIDEVLVYKNSSSATVVNETLML